MILHRLTEKEIQEEFDYYALLVGVVPIYLKLDTENGIPTLAVRNWWPYWLLPVALAVYDFFEKLSVYLGLMGDDYEAGWPVTIQGCIPRDEA